MPAQPPAPPAEPRRQERHGHQHGPSCYWDLREARWVCASERREHEERRGLSPR